MSRTQPLGDGEVTGVSAGRTFPAPGLVAAHKPGSHQRGPPRGRNKATGVMKPHEPAKPMRQMLKEMLQGGQEKDQRAVLKVVFPGGSSGSWAASAAGREAMPGTVPGAKPLGEGDLASQPTPRTNALEDGVSAGRTFSAPGLVAAHKPGSHQRDEVPRKASPLDWLHKVLKPLESPAGVSAGRTFSAPLLITAHKLGSHRRGPLRGKNKATGQKESLESHHILKEIEKELLKGHAMDREALWKAAFPEGKEAIAGVGPGTGDAVGTTQVPDSQKGIRRGCCQGTLCWLGLMAGRLFLLLFFILCCVGIWYVWKTKRVLSWGTHSGCSQCWLPLRLPGQEQPQEQQAEAKQGVPLQLHKSCQTC
ncbi:uncharacterized protein LOC111924455 isoform X2 [Cyanistes caeruleus]|uniref:uncharacterized protein LOC111924455 isoform X2 n=1 Tax=Cyanistes caeruleus TaxID=156563 RepID=UPI000CDB6D92|nr:uncharacterized protein LOC111924455 isoform X2 [Cyanistes caeruleus]